MFNKGFSVWIKQENYFYNIDSAIWVFSFWVLFGILSLPLFAAISKYSCHILLLITTRSKKILHKIDVHTFYNALNFFTIAILILLFTISAYGFFPQQWMPVTVFIALILSATIFKRIVGKGMEWLEVLLDKVTGLTTSEPTRQSIIRSGDGRLLIINMTDQISLPHDSGASHLTIRDVKLRERSGASIVSIYREGKHLANPSPDTELLPDDVLVLMGSIDELKVAKQILVSK